MKLLTLTFLLLFIGCVNGHENKHVRKKQTPPVYTSSYDIEHKRHREIKDSLRLPPPAVDFDTNLKVVLTCEVYQFEGNNRDSASLTKTIKYYSGKRIASELVTDQFKETSDVRSLGALIEYDYKDSLLVQVRIIHSKEVARNIYTYNEDGQLIRTTYYERTKHPDTKPYETDDSNQEYAWRIKSMSDITYDSLGRKIESYSPLVHWDSQNRYKWSYNEGGKILEKRSYEDERLIWVEHYTYTDGEYAFTRTWYDRDGNPKHLKKLKHEHWPRYQFIFKVDDQGREIDKFVTDEKGRFFGRNTMEYNASGKLTKTVEYDSLDNVELTHIYKYSR